MLGDLAEEVVRQLTLHAQEVSLVAEEYIDEEDDLVTRYAQRRVRRDAGIRVYHLEEQTRELYHHTDQSILHPYVPIVTFRSPYVAVRCLLLGLPDGCDATLVLWVGMHQIATFDGPCDAVEAMNDVVL